MPLRNIALALAALALTLTLPACDVGDDGGGNTQATFGDFTFTTTGNATVSEQGGRLVVSNIGSSGQDGIEANLSAAQTDVTLEPVTLPQSGGFRQRYLGASGTEVAQVIHEGVGGGDERVTIDFASSVGAASVRVVYYNNGEVVYVAEPVLGSSVTGSRPSSRIGTGGGGTGSVHVVRVGGRTVVGTDYGGSLTGLEPPSLAPARRGVDFFIPDAERTFLVDFIEFVPLTSSGAIADFEVRSLRMTATNISQFVLTQADEQASATYSYDAFDPAVRGTFFSDQGSFAYWLVNTDTEIVSYLFTGQCYDRGDFSFVERIDLDSYLIRQAGVSFDQQFDMIPEGELLRTRSPASATPEGALAGDSDLIYARSEPPSVGFVPDCSNF